MQLNVRFVGAGVWCALTLLVGVGRAQEWVLPDAPSTSTTIDTGKDAWQDSGPVQPMVASHHAKFIFPGQTAPKLNALNKVNMGLIHGISFYSATGWVLAAEYNQVLNGAPNYGTDTGAYGQRLGSAALRGYSEEVLGTSILAPLLHEDPRFYRMGPGHSVTRRTWYALTRTLVTRNDAGGSEINLSLLGGNLTGAALTNAYYPARNRSVSQTFRTYGGSMGGATFGFVVDEFLPPKLLIRTIFGARGR